MALQTSGMICMDDIKAEFGSTSNCLADYYAGGGIVSAATAPNVPTYGQICMSNFYGASASSPTFPASYSWRPYDGSITGSSMNLIVDNDATSYATFSASGANLETAAIGVTYVKLVRTYNGYQVQFYGPSGLDTFASYDTNNNYRTETKNVWHVAASGNVSPTSVKWNRTLEYIQIGGATIADGTQAVSTNVAPSGSAATYAPNVNTFQSLSINQSIGIMVSSNVRTGPGTTGSASSFWDIEFTLRKSGYDDTTLNFLVVNLATAQNTRSGGGGPGGGGDFNHF